ncbi:MAG TPA: HD-GYP domain-containing protein [Thiohalobacter sp.]|nr:HD-GYP domain-containing protein [Thiohalobacter sp.]
MPYTGLQSEDLRKGVRALSQALDERDRYTWEHCTRLVSLAERTAEYCGLDDNEKQTVKVASLLHDVGKIGIPDLILLKPDRLTADEWEIIKTHSVRGERIVKELEIRHKWTDAAQLIRYHHEHFNGNGYPDGLAGEDIPFGARIISVVDSYDAMTTTRSYAHARTHDEALAIMHEEEGEKSDPYVFRRFLSAINESRGA